MLQEKLEQGLKFHSEGLLSEAKQEYQAALQLSPRCADALHLLGCVALAEKDYETALKQIQHAIHIDSHQAIFYNNLGSVYSKKEEWIAAELCFVKALHLQSNYVDALINLSLALSKQRKNTAAIDLLHQAILITPNNAQLYSELAGLYGEELKFEEQLAMANRALEISVDEKTLIAKAMALKHFSRHREALEVIERLIGIRGDRYPDALKMKADVLEIMGDMKQACELYDQAIALKPNSPGLLASRVQSTKIQNTDVAYQQLMHLSTEVDHFLGLEKTQLCYALGKVHQDLNAMEEAARFYAIGASNLLEINDFDEAVEDKLFGTFEEVFSERYFASLENQGDLTHSPIFILGMPRSGTTLVEQILASHPDVFAAGELSFIVDVSNGVMIEDVKLQRSTHLQIDQNATLKERAEAYLKLVKGMMDGVEKPYFTDKMPENFVNIGLILSFFPNAKIIHCRRDPIDTCISCYVTLFTQRHYWSYDFALLGRMYKRYWSLMNHWRRVLPNRFLEVRYEETVEHPESAARAILEWCGLPWDERVLRFHETDRPVRTASVSQVRQPMYKTSAGRWKKWEPYIQPLLNELAPIHQAYWNEIAKS